MRTFLNMKRALAFAAVFASLSVPASADQPVVVELFTSQSCYSCPPAEAYLGELAVRDDVVALEFHVDYWDDLVYGFAGRWKDVFSDPAYTERQRVYNANIRGTPRVFTPQMVIDGQLQAVGSNRGDVERAIAYRLANNGEAVPVSVARNGNDLTIRVGVAETAVKDAVVWLVRFQDQRTTEVTAGENKGKTLTNHHAVTGLHRVGAWPGHAVTLDLSDVSMAPGEGCAVLVQGDDQGLILGAAACPAPNA